MQLHHSPLLLTETRTYCNRRPEPHVLLFRRPLGTDPTTGAVDEQLRRAEVDKYKRELAEKLEDQQ